MCDFKVGQYVRIKESGGFWRMGRILDNDGVCMLHVQDLDGHKTIVLHKDVENCTEKEAGRVEAVFSAHSRVKQAPIAIKRPHVNKTIKRPSGRPSVDSGDAFCQFFRTLSLEQVYAEVAKLHFDHGRDLTVKELKNRYYKLNPGMQRMNLGNIARGLLKSVDRLQGVDRNEKT